jgi:hypothetical protein
MRNGSSPSDSPCGSLPLAAAWLRKQAFLATLLPRYTRRLGRGIARELDQAGFGSLDMMTRWLAGTSLAGFPRPCCGPW